MPNHDSEQTVVITGGGGEQVALGDGHFDSVFDFSSGLNIISLGNGNFDSFESFGTLNDLVTLGNGDHDSVAFEGTLTVTPFLPNNGGSNIAILGNGNYDLVVDDYYNTPDTIKLGSGAHDTVVLNTGFHQSPEVVSGVAFVTFGGPEAELDLSHVRGPSFSTPTTTGQTSVSTLPLDVISGLVKGDQIILPRDTVQPRDTDLTNQHITLATASNLAGVSHEAVFATGTYNAGAGTFTESATGHDVLLTFDTGAFVFPDALGFSSVVLVGAAGDVTGSTIHHGVITLG